MRLSHRRTSRVWSIDDYIKPSYRRLSRNESTDENTRLLFRRLSRDVLVPDDTYMVVDGPIYDEVTQEDSNHYVATSKDIHQSTNVYVKDNFSKRNQRRSPGPFLVGRNRDQRRLGRRYNRLSSNYFHNTPGRNLNLNNINEVCEECGNKESIDDGKQLEEMWKRYYGVVNKQPKPYQPPGPGVPGRNRQNEYYGDDTQFCGPACRYNTKRVISWFTGYWCLKSMTYHCLWKDDIGYTGIEKKKIFSYEESLSGNIKKGLILTSCLPFLPCIGLNVLSDKLINMCNS